MSKQFINSIKDYAIKIYTRGGNLLPSVTIAQAILESGWGKSGLSKDCYNLFGIKGDYNGNYKVYQTKECYNGKWTTVNAKFRKYPSYYESLLDHDKLMDLERYKRVRESKDYVNQCKYLQICGYATDPNYSNLLTQIIRENNLQQYDTQKNSFKVYPEKKKFMVIVDILNVRDYPSTSGNKVAEYYKGETFISDGIIELNGYVWRTYVNVEGKRRYIATRTLDHKEVYTKTIG